MRPSRARPRFSGLPALLLGAMLVSLAACAPFGVAPPPPRPAIATPTTAATAAEPTATLAPLPQPSVDSGWVASLQIPDGSKFGGPEVLGTPTAGLTSSGTMTVGSFKLAPAAQVTAYYGCASPANVQSTLEIDFGGASAEVPCTPTGASITGASMNRSQWGFAPSDVGLTFQVTVTITTNGPTPRWFALVEQPK